MYRPKGYGFSAFLGLKMGNIHFAHFGLESGVVFKGTAEVYERNWTANSLIFFFAKLLHAKHKDASGEAACARNDRVRPRRKNKTLLFCLAGDNEAVKVT